MVKVNTYEKTKLNSIGDGAQFNRTKTIKKEVTKSQPNNIDINTIEVNA